MEVSFHPAKDRPKTAAALTFFLGIVLQFLWQWTSAPVALVLWGALLFSLRDFFCPNTYRLETDALVVEGLLKYSRRYPWHRFRAYIKDRNGLFLSPYRQRRAMEGQRGVFLPLTSEQRDALEAHCLALGLEKRLR